MADNSKKTNPYVPARPWLKPGERESIKHDTTGQNIAYPNIDRLGRPVKTVETVKQDIMKRITDYEKKNK